MMIVLINCFCPDNVYHPIRQEDMTEGRGKGRYISKSNIGGGVIVSLTGCDILMGVTLGSFVALGIIVVVGVK